VLARDLSPGVRLRINRTFHDVDRRALVAGRVLVVVRHDVFFYDGGHTITFEDGTVIRLAVGVGESDAVLEDVNDEYWQVLGA
jgi:hypothetical protein